MNKTKRNILAEEQEIQTAKHEKGNEKQPKKKREKAEKEAEDTKKQKGKTTYHGKGEREKKNGRQQRNETFIGIDLRRCQ